MTLYSRVSKSFPEDAWNSKPAGGLVRVMSTDGCMTPKYVRRIDQSAILVAVYNSTWTPNLQSVVNHAQWISDMRQGQISYDVLDTRKMTVGEFYDKIYCYEAKYNQVYLYICLHGEVEKCSYMIWLNEKYKISNRTFSDLLIHGTKNVIFMESCHSELFFDTGVLNNSNSFDVSIYNTSEMNEKTYVVIKNSKSYGVITEILKRYDVNPYIAPQKIYSIDNELLKKNFSYEQYIKK